MKKHLLTLFLALMIVGSAQSAKAANVTLNFDSGTGVSSSDAYGDLPDNYGGLSWTGDNALVYNKSSWISLFAPGVEYSTTSGNFSVGQEYTDSPITIETSGGKVFSFWSANFASLVNDVNSITLTGYSGSTSISQTFDILNSATTFYNAGTNFTNLSKLVISSNDSAEFAFDDFTFTFDVYTPTTGGGEEEDPTTPAPEPASAVLGLISLVGLLNKKRK